MGVTVPVADDLHDIERRESQLWLLAFFFIFLLAVGIFLMDATTGERGWQMKIANGTGGNSVKGNVVVVDANADLSFDLEPADGVDPCAVVYEAGIADGSEAWCWMEGSICQVLLKDATAATRGNWARVAVDVAGRATMTSAVPAPPTDATHFREIGHCIQSKDAGADVLALILFHTT